MVRAAHRVQIPRAMVVTRILVLAPLLACTVPAPREPRTGSPLACELRDYEIASVSAYSEAGPGLTRPRGAELVVQAQPGLTAEWLQLQLSRHAAAARQAAPTAECPLDVDDAAVSVRSNGSGFLVRIRTDDEQGAAEILRRARAWLDGNHVPS